MDLYVAVFISVKFTCKGVFASNLISCVSVSTLVGIKLTMAISIGRISCASARFLGITNTFSFLSTGKAGISFGITIGIVTSYFLDASRALSTSFKISSTPSVPTDKRIRFAGTPAASKSLSES